MYVKLILLFIIAAVSVQGQNNSTLNSSKYAIDAAKWEDLRLGFIAGTPYGPVRGRRVLACRIVKECCPNKIDILFTLANENKLEESCSGTVGSELYNSQSSTCKSSLQSFYDIRQTADWVKVNAIASEPAFATLIKINRDSMVAACSTDELNAYFCDPANKELFVPCGAKLLGMSERNGGEDAYNKFYGYLVNETIALVQRVKQVFP